MVEFDYSLNYKRIKFKPNDSRYRIGRGEQGVLLVRYIQMIYVNTGDSKHQDAMISTTRILFLYHTYKDKNDFVGMDMARKFLEMGFTRARRYANHKDGKKYDDNGNIKPQEKRLGNKYKKAKSAQIFKRARDKVCKDPIYITMRKEWRANENANI